MQRLKADQRTKVRNFIQWTQSSETVAINFLVKANWNTEFATQLYFDNPRLFESTSTYQPDKQKMERLFHKYVNARDQLGANTMGPNGVAMFLKDLGIDPCDRKVLLFACKTKAGTQCEFTLEEFITGLTALQADTVETIRERLDALENSLKNDRVKFREIYLFTFNYGKPASQRSLDMETAIAYWEVLFGTEYAIMSSWIEFLRDEHKSAITRDTWNLLLDFVHVIKSDLSDYDEDGAWPVLIDQFVEYARSRYNLPKPGQAIADGPAYY